MLKCIKRYALCFIIGAVGYAIIELLWRGRTHWSMMIAGGICFTMFAVISRLLKGRNIFIKAAVCALVVTAIELIFGLIFNIWLELNVWDYSNQPYNLLGQICPLFSLMWGMVALITLPLADVINGTYA